LSPPFFSKISSPKPVSSCFYYTTIFAQAQNHQNPVKLGLQDILQNSLRNTWQG